MLYVLIPVSCFQGIFNKKNFLMFCYIADTGVGAQLGSRAHPVDLTTIFQGRRPTRFLSRNELVSPNSEVSLETGHDGDPSISFHLDHGGV